MGGMKKQMASALLEAAEDWEARVELSHLLATHVDAKGNRPYFEENVFEPLVDKLVDNGVASMEDLIDFTEEDADEAGISRDDYKRLRGDPRVIEAEREAKEDQGDDDENDEDKRDVKGKTEDKGKQHPFLRNSTAKGILR